MARKKVNLQWITKASSRRATFKRRRNGIKKKVDELATLCGTKFDHLIHQILAHDPNFSPHVIISRFIDGLQDAIRSVVLVHRPEEVLSEVPSKDSKRQDGGSSTKPSFTRCSPPRTLTATPSTGTTKQVEATKQSGVEEKLHNIKQYRRAKGLCFKCGDKWNLAHKCSNTVWHLLSDDDDSSPPDTARLSTDSGEDLMELSLAAIQGTACVQTVLMEGKINQRSVVLLIDSRSSCSFVSHSLTSMLPDWSPLPQLVQIRVANGTILMCTHELQQCPVYVQGHCFTINLKILPLQSYDVILGIDWLQQHSPMELDWKEKWLSFIHQEQKIQLFGLQPDLSSCPVITATEVMQLQDADQLWGIWELFQLEPHHISSSWSLTIPQNRFVKREISFLLYESMDGRHLGLIGTTEKERTSLGEMVEEKTKKVKERIRQLHQLSIWQGKGAAPEPPLPL
ncbi:unnamed protein product [Miscanthus lutarioriparius]|uniref:MADS-box domain-containing protein n=1 Tax=Miscanthus lutarioriparius TaxID=422564 RepID=A0A811PGL3_9POAL|nr:unnamed protein product [Miscanthus lutarioriparius]